MTNVAISGLPAAAALTGAEFIPVVQSGTTSRSTALAVREYVLNDYIDASDYDIDPTGTADSSSGGNEAIQAAIAAKKRLVWPSGIFLLSEPLLCFPGVYNSYNFKMEGQGSGSNTIGGADQAYTLFKTAFTNAPAIVLSNNSGVVLKNFAILGENLAPNAPNSGSNAPTGPSGSQADYITAGCQTGRYAPYCGIAFDPFSNSVANAITSLTQAAQAVVTVSTGSAANPFVPGQMIVFSAVSGMTQINGLTGTVLAVGGTVGHWTATLNINSSGFSAYSTGGSAVVLPNTVATIAGIVSQGSSTLVTFAASNGFAPFQFGQSITFSNVTGMTLINGLTGSITALSRSSTSAWQALVNINSSSFGTYAGGGYAVASDAYTTLAQWYQAIFAGDGSYGCVIENVTISNFVVGIAINLSGDSALAADLTFRNVDVSACDVCYAIGQSQSRNLNIEYGNITGARTGLDGFGYGAGAGTPPQLLRQNFGHLYRLFAFDSWMGNFVIEDCYGESNTCFGQFAAGQGLASAPLTFIGGDFSFGNPTWIAAPILLETYSPTTFLGTGIGVNGVGALNTAIGIPVLNIAHQTIPVTFERCSFATTPDGHSPHIGLSRDGASYCKFKDCWVSNRTVGFVMSNDLGRSFGAGQFVSPAGSGRLEAMYQTYRVSNGATELIYLPPPYFGVGPAAYPQVWVAGVTGETFTVNDGVTTFTFTCSNTAQLMENDILFWSILPQGYSNQPYYWVPALQISAPPSGGTVTCRLLFDPNQYAPTDIGGIAGRVGVAPNHWAPTESLTCSTTNASQTLTGVTPTTILQVGDFVSGAGIPLNTRVTAISVSGSTATVTISQAATATTSSVNLYFGRLYQLTTSPAY